MRRSPIHERRSKSGDPQRGLPSDDTQPIESRATPRRPIPGQTPSGRGPRREIRRARAPGRTARRDRARPAPPTRAPAGRSPGSWGAPPAPAPAWAHRPARPRPRPTGAAASRRGHGRRRGVLAAILASGGTVAALNATGAFDSAAPAAPSAAASVGPQPVSVDESSAVIDVAAKAGPAVVRISTPSASTATRPDADRGRRLGDHLRPERLDPHEPPRRRRREHAPGRAEGRPRYAARSTASTPSPTSRS